MVVAPDFVHAMTFTSVFSYRLGARDRVVVFDSLRDVGEGCIPALVECLGGGWNDACNRKRTGERER